MKICPQCQSQMQEGFILKSNTYGKLKVEIGAAKPGELKAAVCPTCGEVSFSTEKTN